MTYEIKEPFEVGDAAELIQTPKTGLLDEVGGSDGPMHEVVEDE